MNLIRHFFLATALTLLFSFHAFAQKKVCITIDDLPVVGYHLTSDQDWRIITEKILSTCKEMGVPAIGYVNEGKLVVKGHFGQGRLDVLELWLKNGFELGNHTYSHSDYHKSNLDAFKADIVKGESATRSLVNKYEKELKYFRHPYLKSGATKETSEVLEAYLQESDYTPAPVTLDSDDYLFALAYSRAARKGDSTQMKTIGETYVSHTEDKLHFYEQLSEAVFARNIAHTYLMHANQLNGDYLDELLAMFKRNGYTFISQAEVLEDKAYAEPVTKFGNWGMSWLYRWALSRDKGRELFKQDIDVPDFIQKLAN